MDGEMFTTDLRPIRDQIDVPVLVFGSWAAYQAYGATKASVQAGYEGQLKDIKRAELRLAETGYHFVFYDEPVWFYQEIENFMAKNHP